MKYLALILICSGCALSHGARTEDDAPADTIIVAMYDAQPDRGISFLYDGHRDEDASTDPDVQPDVVTIDPDVAMVDEDVLAVDGSDVAVDDATDAQDAVVDSQPDVPMSHIYQVMACAPPTRTVVCATGGCCPDITICGANSANAPRCCTWCSSVYPPSVVNYCQWGTIIRGSDGQSYQCGD